MFFYYKFGWIHILLLNLISVKKFKFVLKFVKYTGECNYFFFLLFPLEYNFQNAQLQSRNQTRIIFRYRNSFRRIDV